MNVLLVGDYSSVHKNLKDGLEQLGHTVVLTSDGDYWKKIPGFDYPMTPVWKFNAKTRMGGALCRRIKRIMEPYYVMFFYLKLSIACKFDVIHMMSADLFDYRYRKKIYRFFNWLSHNRLYVAIPGDDCYVYDAWRKGLYRYSSFDNNPDKIRRFDELNELSKKENEAYRDTIEHAKALIPLNFYEAEIPFKKFGTLRKAIPLPINPMSISYEDNKVLNKIVIYHGISHIENKGSDYILEALDIIKQKYNDKVVIITTKQIPYDEFLKELYNCNIYIDQCKSYAYGMSAVIAMAMGKAVLSGNETEIQQSFEGYTCPVINIIPDTGQIVFELEKLIRNKEQLSEIGKEGRIFIENLHDCKSVAQRYIKEWQV